MLAILKFRTADFYGLNRYFTFSLACTKITEILKYLQIQLPPPSTSVAQSTVLPSLSTDGHLVHPLKASFALYYKQRESF